MVLCSLSSNSTTAALVHVNNDDKENASHAHAAPAAHEEPTRARRRPRSSNGRASPAERRRRPPPHTDMFAAQENAAKSDLAPTLTIATATAKIIFPRSLARPAHKTVAPAALAAIDPALEGVSVRYVQDRLLPLGPALLEMLRNTQAAPATGLPAEVAILVRARCAEPPTHMLAVHSKAPRTHSATAPAKRPVTLFPAHDLVLAAHCANLPPFPPASPDELTLPVVPLCIPSPPTFSVLQTYLYTKRADHLFAALLPKRPANAPAPDMPAKVAALTDALRAAYPPPVLLKHALAVHGLWSNVCVLGVFDEHLWRILDLAWEVLIGAMDRPRASSEDAMDAEARGADTARATRGSEEPLPADRLAPADT